VEKVLLAATQLGSAVVASGLSPDEGLSVFAELQKARRCFVLENELHTIYLVSGIYQLKLWVFFCIFGYAGKVEVHWQLYKMLFISLIAQSHICK